MPNEVIKKDFSADQIGLIKTQIAKGATDDELKLFLYQCQRTGLDPLSRQIYFMKRKVKVGNDYEYKMTVQTSIDGFRAIAERSGDYAGQDEPEFIEEGIGGRLICAKVKVYRFRNDIRYCASVGVAYWDEYVPSQGQDFMWKKMPHTMLSKVAEALALRKAYPQDLSGLYTNDEMDQAAPPVVVEANGNEIPTKEEKLLLKSLVHNSNLSEDEKTLAFETIDTCDNYALFQKIEYRLQDRQQSIDEIQNPLQRDVNNHLKKAIKNPVA